MAHAFSRNHIHLVFSTKDRRNMIAKEWQPRLWAYIAGICENHEMIPIAVGGTENHVHILFHMPPKLALAKAVTLLKANSSKWMGEQSINFSWQDGYGLYLEPAGNVLRSIQRQRIEPQSGDAIHPEPGGTSSENEFRGRISGATSNTWRGIRSQVFVRLAECRPSGACPYVLTRIHRSRGGLRSFAPDGARTIMRANKYLQLRLSRKYKTPRLDRGVLFEVDSVGRADSLSASAPWQERSLGRVAPSALPAFAQGFGG